RRKPESQSPQEPFQRHADHLEGRVSAERAPDHLGIEVIGMPLKRLLRRLRFGPFEKLAERSAAGHVMSNPNGEQSGTLTRVVTLGWATLVVALNLLSQRRAVARQGLKGRRVVIFDRHALDSLVRLRFLYGAAGSAAFQKRLVAAVAPRARLAYLL